MKFSQLEGGYGELWETLEIRPEYKAVAMASAQNVLDGRARYREIEEMVGVPWWFVGLLHKMECNCKFSLHLHNGDRLDERTRRVPKGHPRKGKPPFLWSESAADALRIKGYDKVKDWRPETVAYYAERYNGFGYRYRGINSPYLWSMSRHYGRGKYVRDGVYDPQAVSTQVGVMVTLACMIELDPSICGSAARIAKPEPAPVVIEADEDEMLPKAVPPAPDKKELSKGSRKWRVLDFIKWIFGGGLVGGGGTFSVASQINETRGWLDPVAQFVRDYGVTMLIVAGVGGWIVAEVVQYLIKQDAEDGRYQIREDV